MSEWEGGRGGGALLWRSPADRERCPDQHDHHSRRHPIHDRYRDHLHGKDTTCLHVEYPTLCLSTFIVSNKTTRTVTSILIKSWFPPCSRGDFCHFLEWRIQGSSVSIGGANSAFLAWFSMFLKCTFRGVRGATIDLALHRANWYWSAGISWSKRSNLTHIM